MKKLNQCFWILVVLCVCLSACGISDKLKSDPLERDSLDSFSPMCSDFGIAANIIPENFIENFKYTDGYWCHFIFGKTFFSLFSQSERVLLFFEYDDETYFQAKEYVFENLKLSYSPVEKYNNFVFYDNYTDGESYCFPYSFVRFAYNDSKNTLIFIGCYMSRDFDDNIDEVTNDWGLYLAPHLIGNFQVWSFYKNIDTI